MAFRLPRLPSKQIPWSQLQVWWQRLVEQIEAEETIQNATIDRIRRLLSHTVPTTILEATEDGVSVSIQVLDHTRVYADGTTVSVLGRAPTTGLLAETNYGCYYDDTTLANPSPVFHLTTDVSDAQAATVNGRHWCGVILTPALASGDIIQSGGSYPGGAATIGGELTVMP